MMMCDVMWQQGHMTTINIIIHDITFYEISIIT
jgi:hypothetical protein